MIAYQLGILTGTIVFLLLLNQAIHWLARKILRRPRKQFRQWLTSWIAGPELFVFGLLCESIYQNISHGELSVLLGAVLEWVGLLIFVVKIIASIISRFRRPASVSPPVSPPVRTPAPTRSA